MTHFSKYLLQCTDVKSFEDYCRLWTKEQADAYNYQPLETHINSVAGKWRATSAWQKAIRRGDVTTALRMLNGLWDYEAKYVMYRLPVIMLEDVGWGNPELLLSTMLLCNHQKWLQDNGPAKKIMFMFTEMACHTAKDRTSCDGCVAVDWLYGMPHVDPVVKDLYLLPSIPARQEIVLDRERSWEHRMAAFLSLAGPMYEGAAMAPHPASKGFVNELAQTFSPIGYYGWKIGSSRMRWSMPASTLFAVERLLQTPEVTVDETEFLSYAPDELLGNYPSSTFDWHTQDGKAAFAYFLKACAPFADFLKTYTADDAKSTLMAAMAPFIFRTETGVVDKRLVFDDSVRLTQDTTRVLCMKPGVPADKVQYGLDLMAANLPLLNHARRRVLNLDTPNKPSAVEI